MELKTLNASTWDDVEAYIYNIPKFAPKNTLDNTRKILQLLDVKEGELNIVHIAGTNGKGSVCYYLGKLLQQKYNKVGTFTSPHLIVMTERIQVNGIQIEKEEFVALFIHIHNEIVRAMEKEKLCYPSFFELLFLMSILYFQKEKVDLIILETGLGGRLDATNVFSKPLLTIVTSIGLDHMEYLGNTIEEIASEKAGIIKKNVPVLFFEQDKKITQLFVEKGEKENTCCHILKKNEVKFLDFKNKSIDFSYLSRYYGYITFTINSVALYQMENISLALRGMELLLEEKDIDLFKVKDILFHGKWEGRMEEVVENVYVDGAHNEAGVHSFLNTVRILKNDCNNKNKKFIVIFAAAEDKAYTEMFSRLIDSSLFSRFVVVGMEQKRITGIDVMKDKLASKYTGYSIEYFEHVENAIERYVYNKQDTEIVYIVGSLYLVGFVKGILGGKSDD